MSTRLTAKGREEVEEKVVAEGRIRLQMIMRSCKHFMYRVAGPDQTGFEKEGLNPSIVIGYY